MIRARAGFGFGDKTLPQPTFFKQDLTSSTYASVRTVCLQKRPCIWVLDQSFATNQVSGLLRRRWESSDPDFRLQTRPIVGAEYLFGKLENALKYLWRSVGSSSVNNLGSLLRVHRWKHNLKVIFQFFRVLAGQDRFECPPPAPCLRRFSTM
jgi:hypothetical protein